MTIKLKLHSQHCQCSPPFVSSYGPVQSSPRPFKLVSDTKPCLAIQDRPISTPPATPMAQKSNFGKLPGFGLPVRWIPNIDMYPATLMPCGSGPPDQCVTDQFEYQSQMMVIKDASAHFARISYARLYEPGDRQAWLGERSG